MKILQLLLLTASFSCINIHADQYPPFHIHNPPVNNIIPNNGPSKSEKSENDYLRSQLKAQHESTKFYTAVGGIVGMGISAWGVYRFKYATTKPLLTPLIIWGGGIITGLAFAKHFENQIKDQEFEKLEIKR